MPTSAWLVAIYYWVSKYRLFCYSLRLSLTLISDFAASAPPRDIALLQRFLFLLEKVGGGFVRDDMVV